jgi:hypothetical protein
MRGPYEAKLLSTMLPTKYSLNMVPMDGTIRDTISKEVNSSGASIFVTGFIKAGLAHGNSEEAETLGSTEDLSMRDIHVPSLIVKKPIANNDSRYFVLLTNGSTSCWRGYLLATTLIKPRDQIVVGHFYKDGHGEQDELDDFMKMESVKARYERDFLDRGLNGTFVGVAQDAAAHPGNTFKVALEQISEFLRDHNPDFLIICPRPGIAADKATWKISLTESIIKTINCNMIVCKSTS